MLAVPPERRLSPAAAGSDLAGTLGNTVTFSLQTLLRPGIAALRLSRLRFRAASSWCLFVSTGACSLRLPPGARELA